MHLSVTSRADKGSNTSSRRTPSSTLYTVEKMEAMRVCIFISSSFTTTQNLRTETQHHTQTPDECTESNPNPNPSNRPVERAAPADVQDIQDGSVAAAQLLQAVVEAAFDVQQRSAELWTPAAAEDGQRPLLALLPASKLVLTVANLRGGDRSSATTQQEWEISLALAFDASTVLFLPQPA